MQLIFDLFDRKLEAAQEESDFTYFFNLLVYGECILKLITVVSASCILHSNDRHQYRILYTLVRASGLGEWSKAIDDIYVGTASQYLRTEFKGVQTDVIKKVDANDWQGQSVSKLRDVCEKLDIKIDGSSSGKFDLRIWFRTFTEIRNKTRGHGAIPIGKASCAAPYLFESISLLTKNLRVFEFSVAYLRRNLSGKYRVSYINKKCDSFELLKSNKNIVLSDGVYIAVGGSFVKIPLLAFDADSPDIFIANGGFDTRKYEMLSYLTDDKIYGDSSDYMSPMGELPASESEGLRELRGVDNVFTNVPELNYGYISRVDLENNLYDLLVDDRRTVVTLLGRGGIGKTSLALKVLPKLYASNRYDLIFWFSSRDIDLHLSGAKLVNPKVVTNKDIAKYYTKMTRSEFDTKKFDFLDFFQKQLGHCDLGPCLFVFDNFETTESPIEMFKWIDTYIRNPNKVLITTRLRDFLGDYPVSVQGMSQSESERLIELVASELKILDKLSREDIIDIFEVSSGHPYIIKIMLGEISRRSTRGSLRKIIAGSEDILTALFERTYSSISPCAQRVFLTLSSWNSTVSRLALEAVLMNSTNEPLLVEEAIDSLVQYSLVEQYSSDFDNQLFVLLPYVSLAFGQKKLKVSPIKSLIEEDIRVIRKFGVERSDNKQPKLKNQVHKFLSSFEPNSINFDEVKDILERIGMSYHETWIIFADWLEESGSESLLVEARKYLYRYLENVGLDADKKKAWLSIIRISNHLKDYLHEAHALIEVSQLANVDFFDLSNIVNKINGMLSRRDLRLETYEQKVGLLEKLYQVILKRKNEGDASDYSRIAWLALHLNKVADAKRLVEDGLSLDENDHHCLRILKRLHDD